MDKQATTPVWHCTRCDWFCFGLDTITDADRVLDAHHQAHHTNDTTPKESNQ